MIFEWLLILKRWLYTLPLRPYRSLRLRTYIKDRRVLILGSGPSVGELTHIPEDMLIFSCNFGPQVLLEKNIERSVDLYICTRQILTDPDYLTRIEDLMKDISIRFFIFMRPSFITRKTRIRNYRTLFYSDALRDHLIKQIFPKKNARELAEYGKTSNGIRLLQYALCYGAKEIYLSGMDLHGNGYGIDLKDDNSIYKKAHQGADHAFIDAVSEEYEHIFITSETSPLASIFSQKDPV